MMYIQLDSVNSDLLESKGLDGAFDPNIFTLITDGDDSEIRDFAGTLTLEEVMAEANAGDIIVMDNDCRPDTMPAYSDSRKGYWAGTTVYTL